MRVLNKSKNQSQNINSIKMINLEINFLDQLIWQKARSYAVFIIFMNSPAFMLEPPTSNPSMPPLATKSLALL